MNSDHSQVVLAAEDQHKALAAAGPRCRPLLLPFRRQGFLQRQQDLPEQYSRTSPATDLPLPPDKHQLMSELPHVRLAVNAA